MQQLQWQQWKVCVTLVVLVLMMELVLLQKMCVWPCEEVLVPILQVALMTFLLLRLLHSP